MGVCQSSAKQDVVSLKFRPEISGNTNTSSKSKQSSLFESKTCKNPDKCAQHYKLEPKYLIVNPDLKFQKGVHIVTSQNRLVRLVDRADHKTTDRKVTQIQEMFLIKQLDHPNILKMIEFFEEEHMYYVVYEEFQGQKFMESLQKMQKLTENIVKMLIQQLLEAITFLHDRNIIYRNINPTGIHLTQQNQIMLLDFTNAIQIGGNTTETVGDIHYRAPEMYMSNYGQKVDEWSIGVLMFFLLSGYMPFDGKTGEQIKKSILRGTFSLDTAEFQPISSQAKDLLKQLLKFNPKSRISAQDALNSKWFSKSKKEVEAPNIQHALSNMQRFSRNQNIGDAIAQQILNMTITKEEKQKIQDIFNQLDINHDGQLSAIELRNGFKTYFQQPGKAKSETIDIDQVLANVTLENKQLSFSDFLLLCQDKQSLQSEKALLQIFKGLDRDQSGTLSLEEIRQLLGGNRISDDVWRKILRESNLKKQKQFTREQFVQLIQSTMKQ